MMVIAEGSLVVVRWMSRYWEDFVPVSLGWGRAVGGEYRNIPEIQLQGWRIPWSKFKGFSLSQCRSDALTQQLKCLQDLLLNEGMKKQCSPT